MGCVNVADATAWRVRVQNFLRVGGSAVERRGGKARKLHGQANINSVVAFDQSMKESIGFALRDFVPVDAPVLASASTRRYYVNATELRHDLAAEMGFKTRSCIKRTREDGSTDKFYEVDWTDERKVIVSCSDRGSIGKPSKHWLFCSVGIRGGRLL